MARNVNSTLFFGSGLTLALLLLLLLLSVASIRRSLCSLLVTARSPRVVLLLITATEHNKMHGQIKVTNVHVSVPNENLKGRLASRLTRHNHRHMSLRRHKIMESSGQVRTPNKYQEKCSIHERNLPSAIFPLLSLLPHRFCQAGIFKFPDKKKKKKNKEELQIQQLTSHARAARSH